MKKKITPEQALSRLQTLCAASEQCSFDIRRKISRFGLSAAEADTIIETLEKDLYIDDERYAGAFVRDSYRFSRWGKIRIAKALAMKKIPRHIISAALDKEIDPEEYKSIAEQLILAKARSLDNPSSYENKARLYRFAAYRGYESALIMAILSDI